MFHRINRMRSVRLAKPLSLQETKKDVIGYEIYFVYVCLKNCSFIRTHFEILFKAFTRY